GFLSAAHSGCHQFSTGVPFACQKVDDMTKIGNSRGGIERTTLVSEPPSNGTLSALRASTMARFKPWSWGFAVGTLAIVASAQFIRSSENSAISPAELVRLTVQNEIRATENPNVRHMFAARKETKSGSQTRLYCETRDAMAGMAIAND